MLTAEVERQKLVDEGQVIMDSPDFKDFLAAQAKLLVPITLGSVIVAPLIFIAESAAIPAVFNIAVEFDAKFVGIQSRSRSRQRSGAVVGVTNQVGIGHPV